MPCYYTTLLTIPACQKESTFISKRYLTLHMTLSPRDQHKYSMSTMRPGNGAHNSEGHTMTSASIAPHSPSLKCKTLWKTSKLKSHTAGSRHERRNTGRKRNGCKLCRVSQSTSTPMQAFTNNAPAASPKLQRGSPSPCMYHKQNHYQHPLPAVFSHHPHALPNNLACLQQNLFLCCPTIHLPIAANLCLCNTLPHLHDCLLCPPCLYLIMSLSIALTVCLACV
jgi:hypothetical protein